jgi:ComF family protein
MPQRPLAAPKPALVERVLLRCGGQCAVCRAWSQHQVCESCLLRYAEPTLRCWTCAARLPLELADRRQARCGQCLQHPPPLDRSVSALDYGFPWDGLLQRFKYHQALDLRETLLERLNHALNLAELDAPDWLLPVPLSRERLQERGYNQAHELVKALARRRGLRTDPDLLLRVKHNARQAELNLADRAANVKGVFAVEPTRADELKGSRVAVLDDVMTSGATLFEIARVLRRAGAVEVQAWVVARTPAPHEPG